MLSCTALSWFYSLVSSQYLTSMRCMSRRRMLRSLGRCCLGKVNLLMAGGAVEVLPVSLSCPLYANPKIPPPFIASLLLLCYCVDVQKCGSLVIVCLDVQKCGILLRTSSPF